MKLMYRSKTRGRKIKNMKEKMKETPRQRI